MRHKKRPDWRDKLDGREAALFRKLRTPAAIQGHLDAMPINFDGDDDTCSSPRSALRRGTAHCIEAAMLAAAILKYHGQPAWLMDLKADSRDLDHVVCLFRAGRCWGAISKTRYPSLRYREPVYRSVRELAMSYFHEYFNADGQKTMRSHSGPFSMSRFGAGWVTREGDLWEVARALDRCRHYPVVPRGLRLRDATPFEAWAGELAEWVETPSGPRRRKLRAVPL